ncbi:VOC family protein [Calidifontibacter sp. DB0510]|uniref:VOC family protein n=1 Tax=Metallococcus carri TaxID=1656884 RepID=A0A967EBH6_9MICO|nr:VOC family protein [Metallococcus carri]NHN56959.1 VOC family protein [Metallococcus carri]NOP37704.1 VOC family protein [Calidifontibacter sp. DB2511S]
MASRLNPYLNFADNAAEAMAFYQSVFGGQLDVMKFGDMPNSPAEEADKVMHSMLTTDGGFALMGADTPNGMQQTPNGSVSLSGDDAKELEGYWTKLSDGGQVGVPLEKQMWGDVFGMCTDKYGVTWLVNISQQS